MVTVRHSPRIVVALVLLAGALALGAVVFLVWFRLWFTRPLPLPTPSERAHATQRSSDYLRAWSEGDTGTMVAMMSPASRFRTGGFPSFSGGKVAVTGEFARPSMPIARAVVTAFARKNHWARWRHGRVAFVVYQHGSQRYFLILVREDKQWWVLNGPGSDLDLAPLE